MIDEILSPRKHRLVLYYEGTSVGGVSTVVKDLASAATSQFETTVVCPDTSPLLSWRIELRRQRVHVEPLALDKRLAFGGWINPKTRYRLRQCFRHADIVHFHQHTPFACLAAISLAHSTRAPRLVATEHYLPQLRYLRRRHLAPPLAALREMRIAFSMKMKRRSLHCLDRIITVSHSNAHFFLETFGASWSSHVTTITNGVDLTRFVAQPAAETLVPEGIPLQKNTFPVVTVVAGLNNQKGHSTLIHAIPSIVREFPGVRFLFVGEGHLRASLQQLAQQQGIADHIIFTGERHDIPQILALADLFVLPSLFEGMPLSVLEAMAAGKAVVATAVDGTTEVVVNRETGLLVPPGDSEHLAEAILLLLRDKMLCASFGVRGRERVRQLFSCEAVWKEHARAYESLLGIQRST